MRGRVIKLRTQLATETSDTKSVLQLRLLEIFKVPSYLQRTAEIPSLGDLTEEPLVLQGANPSEDVTVLDQPRNTARPPTESTTRQSKETARRI